MKKLYLFSMTYVMGLCLIFLFQLISDDKLLFKSDLFSLIIFDSFIALPFFFIFLTIFFILSKVKKIKPHLDHIRATLTLALCLSCFSVGYFDHYGIPLKNVSFDTVGKVLWVVALSFVLCYILMRFASHRDSIRTRIQHLSAFFSILFIGASAGHLGYNLFLKTQKNGQPKHMILIVLDGLPSAEFATYNPKVMPTEFDTVMKRGVVYHKAYTNKTYTSGFFGAFYSGRLDIKPAPIPVKIEKNLVKILQDHNVNVRYLVTHQNGVPEVSQIHDYHGLRSYQLSEFYSWLPEFLGIDYHVFLESTEGGLFLPSSRHSSVFAVLHPNAKDFQKNKWDTVLRKQIELLQEKSENSLLILHLLPKRHNKTPQQLQFDKESAYAELYQYAAQHDYEITEEHNKYLPSIRKDYRDIVEAHGKRIKELLDYLEESGRLENTTIIVTADHGTSLGNNRIWYGYHPNEEVTRVPLIVFRKDQIGESHDLVDTLDIAQTILSHFNTEEHLHPKARSIFSLSDKKNINTYTLRANTRKEHFVVIYDHDCKYLFNLHPEGDARAVFGQVEGYDFNNISDIPEGHRVWENLLEAMRDFNFTKEEVHPRYQKFCP